MTNNTVWHYGYRIAPALELIAVDSGLEDLLGFSWGSLEKTPSLLLKYISKNFRVAFTDLFLSRKSHQEVFLMWKHATEPNRDLLLLHIHDVVEISIENCWVSGVVYLIESIKDIQKMLPLELSELQEKKHSLYLKDRYDNIISFDDAPQVCNPFSHSILKATGSLELLSCFNKYENQVMRTKKIVRPIELSSENEEKATHYFDLFFPVLDRYSQWVAIGGMLEKNASERLEEVEGFEKCIINTQEDLPEQVWNYCAVDNTGFIYSITSVDNIHQMIKNEIIQINSLGAQDNFDSLLQYAVCQEICDFGEREPFGLEKCVGSNIQEVMDPHAALLLQARIQEVIQTKKPAIFCYEMKQRQYKAYLIASQILDRVCIISQNETFFISMNAKLNQIFDAVSTLQEKLDYLTRYNAEQQDGKMAVLEKIYLNVRKPAHGILDMVRLIKKVPVSAIHSVNLDNIYSALQNVLLILNSVINLHHLLTEEVYFNLKPVDIKEVIENVFCEPQFSALKDRMELQIRWDEAVDFLLIADPYQLSRLVEGLILGFFMLTFSQVVSLDISFHSEEKGYLSLLFKMSFSGELKIKKISEKEWLPSALSQEWPALSLSICRHLTELMGGKMWVEEESYKKYDAYLLLSFEKSMSCLSGSCV